MADCWAVWKVDTKAVKKVHLKVAWLEHFGVVGMVVAKAEWKVV